MIIRLAIIIILTILITGNVYPQDEAVKTTTNSKISLELNNKIRSVLPSDWIVDDLESGLWIEKREPVLALITAPSMSIEAKASKISYYFSLRLTDYISPDDFKLIEKRNREIIQEAEHLYKTKIFQHIPLSVDRLSPLGKKIKPRTREEAKLVDKYQYLYSQIKQLPDYYFNNQSFFFIQPGYSFENKNDERICQNITQKILGLLTKYEKK